MSDLPKQVGEGSGLVALFILGANWARSFLFPKGKNGNGEESMKSRIAVECPMISPQAAELQIVKLGKEVSGILVPHLERQTEVFEQIRDVLRDLKNQRSFGGKQ